MGVHLSTSPFLLCSLGTHRANLQFSPGDLVASLDLPECFDRARLEREFKQLTEYVKERDLDVKTASDLASALASDNNVVRCLFREVHVEHLLQLIMVQPCSNASSERSLSSLHHLKTYLRSTVTQQRLTHTAMLKVHADILQGLGEFFCFKNTRKNCCCFGK